MKGDRVEKRYSTSFILLNKLLSLSPLRSLSHLYTE